MFVWCQAWLHAYHVDPLASPLALESLPMRAGVIRAAVNLDLRATGGGAVAVLAAGLNGQLPNLDLVNTAVAALHDQRIPVRLDRCVSYHRFYHVRD